MRGKYPISPYKLQKSEGVGLKYAAIGYGITKQTIKINKIFELIFERFLNKNHFFLQILNLY